MLLASLAGGRKWERACPAKRRAGGARSQEQQINNGERLELNPHPNQTTASAPPAVQREAGHLQDPTGTALGLRAVMIL